MSGARVGHLAMLLFSMLVAGSFALGALAANEITPSALNAVRFWIATVIIGAVAPRGAQYPERGRCSAPVAVVAIESHYGAGGASGRLSE